MEEEALKIELRDKIEHADLRQLLEINWLITDYLNKPVTAGELDSLAQYQNKKTEESIRQAKAGLSTPAKEVVHRSREMLGLND